MTIFLDMMPHSPAEVHWQFRWMYCLQNTSSLLPDYTLTYAEDSTIKSDRSPNELGAHHSVVGSGTMLQAGRSWVWFLMRSLESSIDLFLPARLWPSSSPSLWIEMSTRNLPGGKGHLVHKADNLTTTCELTIENVGTFHNPMGLHGLLQGQLYLLIN
jgi:hypothetical protein